MKIAINKCYGGFSLSHEAEMEVARRKGIELYPFINKRRKDGSLDFHKFEPYLGEKELLIFYATKPLEKDGTYKEDSYYSGGRNLERNDPILIQVIEDMGEKASGRCAQLKIVEIPDDVEWEIDEYDGMESVSEKHNTWY